MERDATLHFFIEYRFTTLLVNDRRIEGTVAGGT
jgi:hypothetical protein